jgi:plastocyanin
MRVKHMVTTLAAATAVVAGTASAATPAAHLSIVIRHQMRGCHTWSVDGGVWKATQAVTVRRGGSITVKNNDVMPHQLVKTSGPALQIPLRGAMAHMGATLKVTFVQAGTYRFTTKAGEDYMPGMKTIGEDNVLRLTVTVS